MPAVFRCFFLAMQPSLAMVICDLWDSPTIKRKSERWMVHVPIMVSHIQESTDYFGGWGLPHYAMSFFLRVCGCLSSQKIHDETELKRREAGRQASECQLYDLVLQVEMRFHRCISGG
jgi:hypothetical protein